MWATASRSTWAWTCFRQVVAIISCRCAEGFWRFCWFYTASKIEITEENKTLSWLPWLHMLKSGGFKALVLLSFTLARFVRGSEHNTQPLINYHYRLHLSTLRADFAQQITDTYSTVCNTSESRSMLDTISYYGQTTMTIIPGLDGTTLYHNTSHEWTKSLVALPHSGSNGEWERRLHQSTSLNELISLANRQTYVIISQFNNPSISLDWDQHTSLTLTLTQQALLTEARITDEGDKLGNDFFALIHLAAKLQLLRV